VLTITAGPASSGSVRRLPDAGTATNYPVTEIDSDETISLGPFTNDRSYEILTNVGPALTFATTVPDASLATREKFHGTIPAGETIATDGEEYNPGAHSYQPVGPDLNLHADAGGEDNDPKFLSAVMGNVLGADLTKEGAYLAGVIAALSITGTRATLWQIAACIGIVMDGVTDCDAAVLAVIDGSDPSSITRARAAFGVAMNNNNAGSGVDYGLDLLDAGRGALMSGGKAFAIAKALVRSPNEVCQLEGDGAPSGSTGAGFAGKGSRYTDYTTPDEYINVGDKTTPSWKKLTRAT
jgi:hypothetical protein